MPTTFRVDVVTGIVSTLNTYKSSNPTLLRDVHTARPAHIGETPVAWLGNRNETEVHTTGLRDRVISVDVVVADVVPDNEQAAGRMDILWDALADAFTAAPHLVSSSSVAEVTTIAEGEVDYGGVPYRVLIFTVQAIKSEGRN
jgi:hypothetical protein